MGDVYICQKHGETEYTDPDVNGTCFCKQCWDEWIKESGYVAAPGATESLGLSMGTTIDDNYVTLKTGSFSQEDLANILADILTKRVEGTRNAMVDFLWRQVGDQLACDYVIKKHKSEFIDAKDDPLILRVARATIAENRELSDLVKGRKPGALNHLVGEVMQAIHKETGSVEPEKAFELVVNLLGMVEEP